jgi:hypothetical protein
MMASSGSAGGQGGGSGSGNVYGQVNVTNLQNGLSMQTAQNKAHVAAANQSLSQDRVQFNLPS